MSVAFLSELMNSLPRESLLECTLECAPGTVTKETARAWKTCGINRVSLGVQSFVEAELRQTGRGHTAETVEQDVGVLLDAGIHNINVDLIAGLPGQTGLSWQQSLSWIERLRPRHVSIYIFEVDEDSRLGKEVLLGGTRYGAPSIPADDLTADLYEEAVQYLAALGIQRYEISNFAKPGRESLHNLKYWKGEPYVGFGLDAHSFDGQRRWANSDRLLQYCDIAQRVTDSSMSDRAEEHFFVGLRLSAGIEPSQQEWSRFQVPIDKWVAAGMLERFGSRLRLTDRGILISNEVLQEFVNV